MINVYPASSRYAAEHDWLRSRFSFSFGPYYDPQNTAFGPMRVLNDDFVAPQKGFGAHPHSDMEVVSIVLQGKLKHQDNLGNIGITSWGEIQRMTAGTGIIHTEYSADESEELNLLQMWFMPERRGLEPSYEISSFDSDSLTGRLVPVVSQESGPHVAKIHQDMTIYLGRCLAGQTLSFETVVERRVFLFVIDGEAVLNTETPLSARDAVRIEGETSMHITAGAADALLLLIDLP